MPASLHRPVGSMLWGERGETLCIRQASFYVPGEGSFRDPPFQGGGYPPPRGEAFPADPVSRWVPAGPTFPSPPPPDQRKENRGAGSTGVGVPDADVAVRATGHQTGVVGAESHGLDAGVLPKACGSGGAFSDFSPDKGVRSAKKIGFVFARSFGRANREGRSWASSSICVLQEAAWASPKNENSLYIRTKSTQS